MCRERERKKEGGREEGREGRRKEEGRENQRKTHRHQTHTGTHRHTHTHTDLMMARGLGRFVFQVRCLLLVYPSIVAFVSAATGVASVSKDT